MRPLTVCAAALALALAQSASAAEIPAGTVLQVRLQQLLSSFGSQIDTRISAMVIAPVEIDGRIVLPLESTLLGHVEAVRRVGLGLSRETAYLQISFDTLRLPDGRTVPAAGQVVELDNARETVDPAGRIHGLRSTASFSSRLSGLAVSAGVLDPMLLAFTASSSLSVFRIPESEIVLPAGTELHVRLLEPITVEGDFARVAPPLVTTKEADELTAFVRSLPFRTATDAGVPSDLTNLVLLGSEDAIARAFDAAGWGATAPLSPRSTYATLRAVVENQGYEEAPVSTLLLDGMPPRLTYAKTLDTFFKRHHLRIFGPFGPYQGRTVWTASATHDIGIAFATRTKSFIHVIDQHIDDERRKVVYDLVLTGCVEGVTMVDRPAVPLDAKNATGDELRTDGRSAVVALTDCDTPHRADAPSPAGPAVRARPTLPERIVRDFNLWLRNDAFRGNIVYQGYWGARNGIEALRRKPSPSGTRVIRLGGEEFEVVPGGERQTHDMAPVDADRQKPSFEPVGQRRRSFETVLEFSISGGHSGFGGNQPTTQLLEIAVPQGVSGPVTASAADTWSMQSGGGFGLRTTLNTHRHFSHEVAYVFSTAHVASLFDSPPEAPVESTSPARIRQFSYNLLAHIRPNGTRVRPYGAAGAGLQVVRLAGPAEGVPHAKTGLYRDVGWLGGAWNFTRPPLEGGGILQPMLQYGGGVKVLLSPHWVVRIDFRETLSEQPDFWDDAADIERLNEPDGTTVTTGAFVTHGPLRHRLFSAGVGVAF